MTDERGSVGQQSGFKAWFVHKLMRQLQRDEAYRVLDAWGRKREKGKGKRTFLRMKRSKQDEVWMSMKV